MQVTSTAFQHNEPIPAKYSCEGANVNPPLTFSEVPKKAKSLVLLVEDPDAPNGTFTHWVLYDMPPTILQILENETPEIGKQGLSDFGEAVYGGPCPPSGQHRYFFKLFALNTMLNLAEGVRAQEVYDAMEGKVIGSAELVGLYEKKGA